MTVVASVTPLALARKADRPSHWSVVPLAYLFDSIGGATPSKDNAAFWRGQIPWVSPKDMKRDVISDAEDHISEGAVRETRLKLIEPPAVLIVVRGMILAHSIPVAITASYVTINQDMKALLPKPGVLPQYLGYLLRAKESDLFSTIEESGHGTRCLRLDLWKKVKVAVPPPTEQKQLVAFLDRKTAQLDELIAKQQQMIDLLQQKRRALIDRIVSNGLASGRVRPSGIDWFGNVPKDWNVTRVKFVSHFVTSGSRGWAAHYADEGPLFIRIGNLSRTGIDLRLDDLQRVTPPQNAEAARTRVVADDLLVSVTAYIGSVGVVPAGLGEAYMNQHTALVRPRQDVVNTRWLAYVLFARVGQFQFKQVTQGGTKEGIGLDDVQNLVVLVPPRDEQDRLVSYLDTAMRLNSRLCSRTEMQIDKLREYRQTLIAAAVTGKISVPRVG